MSKSTLSFYRNMYEKELDEEFKMLTWQMNEGGGRKNIHLLTTLNKVETLVTTLNHLDFFEEKYQETAKKAFPIRHR